MNKICKYCNKPIKGNHAIYANHIRWCNDNPDNKKSNIKNGVLNRFNRELGKLKDFKVHCHLCNKIFIVRERESQFPKKEKYFCSRSCANTRQHSEETKNKIRNKARISTENLILNQRKESEMAFKDKFNKLKEAVEKGAGVAGSAIKNGLNHGTAGRERTRRYDESCMTCDNLFNNSNTQCETCIKFNNWTLMRDIVFTD